MMKKLITTIYFIYVIFMISFGNVYSVEWDCAATTNTGTFTRSTGEIALHGQEGERDKRDNLLNTKSQKITQF